ncbi:hypothetical protein BD779DRAFT_394192 [Infundibulicybe gibba]|nr:hypothetical protein BD779DRAFT_394192 [Infundibulicybe gibba]
MPAVRKPSTCTRCGTTTTSASTLARHRESHCPFREITGIAKPKCQYCNASMSRRDAVRRHEKKCPSRGTTGRISCQANTNHPQFFAATFPGQIPGHLPKDFSPQRSYPYGYEPTWYPLGEVDSHTTLLAGALNPPSQSCFNPPGVYFTGNDHYVWTA